MLTWLLRLLCYRLPERRMGALAGELFDPRTADERAWEIEHDLDSESHAAWMRATRRPETE